MWNYRTVYIFKFISLSLLAVLTSGCAGLLFHPIKQHVRTPKVIGLSYENVTLQTSDDIKLHGWLLPAQGELKGSVLFLHGNAENISTHIASVYWLPEQGYQVFLLDYRGFGTSEGKPGLPEVFLDIEAGLEWLLKRATDKPVFMLGQSLGASLTIHYAANSLLAKEHLSGVVSDAAFGSYFEITRHVAGKLWLTWPIQYPLAWSMNYPYNPVDTIAKLAPTPILILHSRDDEIIPYTNATQLYTAAQQPKLFHPTEGKHIETFAHLHNRSVLLEFFEAQSVDYAINKVGNIGNFF